MPQMMQETLRNCGMSYGKTINGIDVVGRKIAHFVIIILYHYLNFKHQGRNNYGRKDGSMERT